MHLDQWKDTLAMVKQKFTVLSEGKEDLEDIPRGFVEFVEFSSPQGKMRLEFITKPVVLDKKTIYSKLGKTASNVQYVYSESEFTHRLEAYKWNEAIGEWEEMRTPMV